MPSASTTICTQCDQPSKYTCPTCTARTCSLACSKAHKSTCSVVTTSSVSSASSSIAGPSTVSTPPASALPGLDFIPMTHYTDSHMMQDYLFLSSLSRATAEAGRKIASLNLFSPPTTSSSTHDTRKHTPQQRQRDQLIKQLHYRRFKIMLLPEGMARRSANQSVFGRGKFSMSVEVKFIGKGGGVMVHRQATTSTVQSIVLGELQRRSFTSGKDLSRLRSTYCSKTTSNAWFVAQHIIEALQLPIPSKVSSVDDAKVVLLHNWPTEWKVLVPIYSARLTNESTTRYLDWWSRKRKWEERNPGLTWVGREERQVQQRGGKQRLGDGEGGQDDGWDGKRKRVGGWGRERVEDGDAAVVEEVQSRSGYCPVEQVTTENVAERGSEASIGGQAIVSSSLLSMLSQRLGRNLAPGTALSGLPSMSASGPATSLSASCLNPDAVADPTLSSTTTTTTNSTANPSDPKHNTSTTSTIPSATAVDTATSLTLFILNPSHTTLGHLLTDLPEGYGVVEFPEFRVVGADSAAVVGSVAFGGEGVAPEGEGEERGQEINEEGGKRGTGKSGEEVKREVTGGSLQSLLASYGSDSDNDDEQQQDGATAEHYKSDTEEAVDTVAQDDDAQDYAASSLASIASKHGFT